MDPTFLRFLQTYSVPPAQAELAHLRLIAKAFSVLPYENITKILKEAKCGGSRQKLREAPELLEDHLRWGTGGTCFSLSNALHQLLRQSGFDSHICMADMHYGRNIHCAVIVRTGTLRYLLDPGYLLTEPMLLPSEGAENRVQTAMNTVHLKAETEDDFSLYTQEPSGLKWRYRLHAIPISIEDFTQHWIHSFSLNSMENVMLSRLDPSGRIYFRKNRLELVNPRGRESKNLRATDAHDLALVFGVPADLILQAHNLVLSRIY